MAEQTGQLSINGWGNFHGGFNYCQGNLGFTQSQYQNYSSSFARFFGKSSYQDLNYLVIKKAELPNLTIASNNTSESLLVSLLLKVMIDESNDLISNITVEILRQDFVTVNRVSYIKHILFVKFYALVTYIGEEITNYDVPITPNNI